MKNDKVLAPEYGGNGTTTGRCAGIKAEYDALFIKVDEYSFILKKKQQ